LNEVLRQFENKYFGFSKIHIYIWVVISVSLDFTLQTLHSFNWNLQCVKPDFSDTLHFNISTLDGTLGLLFQ
jgi:hypothetical protein